MDKQNRDSNNKAMNHVAVSVPDLDKAVNWYHKVLGCDILTKPIEGKSDNSQLGKILSDIFGVNFKKLRLVHMTFKNQIGFEVFEFIEPKSEKPQNNFEYWKTSFFHICITEPDIENITKKIAESGGKLRSKIWKPFPDKSFKIAFCEDPFGNIIEIYTHSYEDFWNHSS